jgi:hypothetical protein
MKEGKTILNVSENKLFRDTTTDFKKENTHRKAFTF